jgi:maltose alpha-D-glucosyltransferase / alpha-amylase
MPAEPTVRRLTEATNNAVVFGEHLLLKGSRRLRPGADRALEIGRFLTKHAPEVHAVPVGGSIELEVSDGTVTTLASLQGYVENQGDAWSYTQGYLERFLTNSLAAPPNGGLADAEVHAGYCVLMATLGRRTAELHAALAAARGDPAFEPEPIGADEPAAWARTLTDDAVTTLERLKRDLGVLSGPALAAAGTVLADADRVATRLAELGRPVEAMKTRLHGDFHLGQVLIVGSDVLLTGFGAGPSGASRERGPKESPLRDLAGLLRSLDYALATALIKVTAERAGDLKMLAPLARAWGAEAGAAFMAGYREGIRGCPALPADPGAAQRLLTLFRFEWTFHDLRDELANRPDWAMVPLQALADMLDASVAGAAMP